MRGCSRCRAPRNLPSRSATASRGGSARARSRARPCWAVRRGSWPKTSVKWNGRLTAPTWPSFAVRGRGVLRVSDRQCALSHVRVHQRHPLLAGRQAHRVRRSSALRRRRRFRLDGGSCRTPDRADAGSPRNDPRARVVARRNEVWQEGKGSSASRGHDRRRTADRGRARQA